MLMTLNEARTQGTDCCQFDVYSCYRIWKCEVIPSWGFCFYKLKKLLSNHTVCLMVEISMNVSGSGMMWCGYAFLFSLPAQYWPFTNRHYHVDGRNLQLWPPCLTLCYSTFFCTSGCISSQLHFSDRKRKCLWTEILKTCQLYYLIEWNEYYFPLTLISCGVKSCSSEISNKHCWVWQNGESMSDPLPAGDIAYWKLRKKTTLNNSNDRKNTL